MKRKRLQGSALLAFFCFTAIVTFYQVPWMQDRACDLLSSVARRGLCPVGQKADFNLFYHLGGNGPWIERASGIRVQSESLPFKCEVDQVHLLSRHAERYPTTNAGRRHAALLQRLQSPPTQLSGPLSFVKNWTYFTDPSVPLFENLTSTGPYAGTVQAYETGKKLQRRYGHLLSPNRTTPTSFWTCSSPRDIDTAEWFGRGFFGDRWKEDGSAVLHVVPETKDRGGNTLTPGDTCLNYINDEQHGHDHGYHELAKWQETFSKPIAARLNNAANGLSFKAIEIYGMMEICGFEILVRGSSPWCEVFTRDDWQQFEYARDLLHFYRAGPGNKYAGAMGLLWLDATTKLLNNDSRSASGVYFSFVHDGDIVPVLATLGLFDEHSARQELPSNQVKHDRTWKTSDLVPMGGRLVVERITCKDTGLARNLRRSYVRLSINDGLVALDVTKNPMAGGLPSGIGLEQWKKLMREKHDLFGDFKTVCGLSEDAPAEISFLHQ